jgi:hypothetical protein
MPMLVSVLIDSLVASLSAPVSAATLAEMQGNERQRA